MISADVPSLARAAPTPAVTTRMNTRDSDSTFDQLFQAVAPDRSTEQNSPRIGDNSATRSTDDSSVRQPGDISETSRRNLDRKESRGNVRQEKVTREETRQTERKTSEPKSSDEKPVNDVKTEKAVSSDEKVEAKAAEDAVQEAIAGAMAAQAAMAVKPEVPVELVEKSSTPAETAAGMAATPVAQQQQTPVIQLPDTEPQPLPDELKQAMPQTKVEVKDFQAAINNAAKEMENQAQPVTAPASQPAASTQTAAVPGIQNLSAQETTVKVVQIAAQPEDMTEVDSTKALTSVYASATAKTENLVEAKPLPMIQKISHEIVELAREHGKSMKIQIQPENMGKIDLRLVSNSDGMRIVMTTEVPATGKLLETHLDQLQRQLADAGVSISGMSVNSQNAQGQSANASQNRSNTGSGRPAAPILHQEPEVVASVAPHVSASGLDYRI